jgi:hypothetical protein
MPGSAANDAWPDLPYMAWRETGEALRLWMQVAGKIRLALTPWLNHSWHVPLYLTARGLGTSPIPYRGRSFEIVFDFIEQVVAIVTSDGARRDIPLRAATTADFYAAMMASLAALGIEVAISELPSEIAGATPFGRDHAHRAYDGEQAQRFWRILLQADRVLKLFRTGFIGKASPVHFFWGSFDLAVTRFSGRPAPVHPGGVPGLKDAVVREAYSHEVSSAGFWPGGGGADYAAFYSYAYPEPQGFRSWPVRPAAAFFSEPLGEFLLPYAAVREAADPDAALLAFLQSTYEAAAVTGNWDRAGLECAVGAPGIPRPVP